MRIPVALGGLAIVLLLWGILTYNRLKAMREKADASLRDIDAQLKKRWDLIPVILEAIQAYARHEPDVLEQIAAAKARSQAASSLREKAQAEEGLKESMRIVFASVEHYPALKADDHFLELQQSLEQVEDGIQRSRHYYNAVVRDYNLSIESFPRNYIAGIFGFHKREFYSLTGGAERTPSSVRYS